MVDIDAESERQVHTRHDRIVLPAVDVAAVLASDLPVVDLRSPGEFADDHLPGAANVPLFDDAERALVGTLYKQASPEQAFEAGLSIVEDKVADLVVGTARAAGHGSLDRSKALERMREIARGGKRGLERRIASEPACDGDHREGAFVVHCWRGGLRSQSVCALLRELGLPALQLRGGYKAYRRHVLDRLAELELPPALVLRGLTGVGKTLVLHELERLAPGLTIDLEGLAEHRSSILGAAGREPVSQKTFESRLVERHDRGCPHGRVVFEGESRKVGDVILPERLWRSLKQGVDLRLVAPLERRVQVLVEDYLAQEGSEAHLREKLPFLEQRIGSTRFAGVLVDLLDTGRHAELVEVLLERYYDPLYRHSEPSHRVAAEFDASDPAACARAVLAWIDSNGG